MPPPVCPTYKELKSASPGNGVGIGTAKAGPGFQVHYIMPVYLGSSLGYTRRDMDHNPATAIPHWNHNAKANPQSIHNAIRKHLPETQKGRRATYTPKQSRQGLENAYSEVGRLDLFEAIKPYLDGKNHCEAQRNTTGI